MEEKPVSRFRYILVPVFLVVTACSGGKQGEPAGQKESPRQSADAPSAGQSQLAAGFALFNKSCRVCHGNNGNGNGSRPGPSLQRSEYTYGRNREAVIESIRSGRPGGMPAYGTVFSNEQLEALTSYVLILK